jgi:VWFA-related protein
MGCAPRSASRPRLQPRLTRSVAVAAAIASLLTSVPAAQQTPAFTAGTDLVVVDVLVSRNGAPVTGLTADDFTVRDGGVPQKVTLAAVESMPVRLLLALDSSASVRGPALDQLKQAAKTAIGSLRPADEAGVLSFAHNLSQTSPWTANRDQVSQAIDTVTARGSTALADAAFSAIAMAPRAGTRTLVVVFTDGSDTASWLSPTQVLQAARRSESIVYGVTLAGNASEVPLDQLESWVTAEPTLYRSGLLPLLVRQTGGEMMRAAGMPTLGETFVAILSRFNQRYVLTYSPAGVPAAGWHPLEVAVRGGGDVIARRGYFR